MDELIATKPTHWITLLQIEEIVAASIRSVSLRSLKVAVVRLFSLSRFLGPE
jgi:hypothetical protein